MDQLGSDVVARQAERMETIVIGASGGIGSALADHYETAGDHVHRLSRRDTGLDLSDEANIGAAAAAIAPGSIGRLIIATGVLHEGGLRPERSLRDLSLADLQQSFLINAIGPALLLRHFTPLLLRDGRVEIGVLSARVGSIADNRLGGWYGYRASKAALNQIVRTAAIELKRSRPQSLVVALHPGTVDTAMSRPFQANVPAEKLFTPELAASQLAEVLSSLRPEDSGGFFDWRGESIPF